MNELTTQDRAVAVFWHSDSILAIAPAYVVCQAAIRGARKDASNPHFQAKYADLSSIMEAGRGAMAANDLALLQLPACDGKVATITSVLLHKSGEWFACELSLEPQQKTPQGFGSALTYCRRYSAAPLLGIAPEDDDGNAAEGRGSKDAAKAVGREKLKAAGRTVPPELEEEIPPEATVRTLKAALNFKMLGAFRAIKKSLGEKDYYEILKRFGYEKSNAIPDDATGRKIYKAMGERLSEQKEANAETHGSAVGTGEMNGWPFGPSNPFSIKASMALFAGLKDRCDVANVRFAQFVPDAVLTSTAGSAMDCYVALNKALADSEAKISAEAGA